MRKAQTTRKRSAAKPTGDVEVAMYDVGFGDCFLLSFPYTNGDTRRVLIDCGTTTKGKTEKWSQALFALIAKDCQPDSAQPPKLDALVVTHRHTDHLSALRYASVQKQLLDIKPEVIVLPWVDHPDVKGSDTKPPRGLGTRSLAHAAALSKAQAFVEQLVENPEALPKAIAPSLRKRLLAAAASNVRNREIVAWLNNVPAKHSYVSVGGSCLLKGILPGIKVTVLGPPTAEDWPDILKTTPANSDQYWLCRSSALASAGRDGKAGGNARLFARAHVRSPGRVPYAARWAVSRIERCEGENLRGILEMLDDAVNNTSVILLFEVAGKALLFSGDAEWANWQYVLEKRKSLAHGLSRVNLYKVGHHGSRNATPKMLWNDYLTKEKRTPFIALLSTDPSTRDDVLSENLVRELGKKADLERTDKWHKPKDGAPTREVYRL